MTRALVTILLILGQFPVAAATRARAVRQPAAPAAIVAAARQSAQEALTAGVPAVEIAVSQHGRIIYAESFGVTDVQSATAATTRSVMQIGSVTKQFTAAAILRLAERGALTLDDRIEKFVPEFNPRGATVTLRHLLTHTSGLPRDWFAPTSTVDVTAPVTRGQAINSLNAQPFDFAPGKKWSYSNAGYLLLGYAIESITGRPYADFIRDEFTLPLGLIDTGVCGTHNVPLPEGYATANTPNGLIWMPMPSFSMTVALGSGSICSTASDLARWSHLLATGYVLLPASYASMTTAARLDNNLVVSSLYAMGVGVTPFQGHPAVGHDGAIFGYQSFLLYLSDEDIAVAVMTNAFPAPASLTPANIALPVVQAALATQ